MSGSEERCPRLWIFEDEAMIAIYLSDAAVAYGWSVMAIEGQLERVRFAAASEGPADAAVLDLRFDGEWAFDVAETLLARGVPFVIYTGVEPDQLPASIQRLPCFAKPCEPEVLFGRLRQMTDQPNETAYPFRHAADTTSSDSGPRASARTLPPAAPSTQSRSQHSTLCSERLWTPRKRCLADPADLLVGADCHVGERGGGGEHDPSPRMRPQRSNQSRPIRR